MKYFFCKLHAPRPTFAQDLTPAEAKLMQAHAAYLQRFAEQGQAVVFGPVADPAGAFGVAIWELPDDADLPAICAADPVVAAGLGFRYEIHPMPRAVMRK
ncbi:MAG TPA: YciI family protein [Opitutaceae bacterium]|nr:YciI family protein [Opitutaceae bacterium]